MADVTQRNDSQLELWDAFDKFMDERGYRVMVHDDHLMGRGSVACKDDRLVPMVNLHVWGGEVADHFVSIFVEDRNGSAILHGDTAAIYSMVDTGDKEKNMLLFSKMLNDAYEKYGGYSKANRLDFAFNEMKQDRRVYDDKVLSFGYSNGAKTVDELIHNATSVSKDTGDSGVAVDVNIEKE